MINFFKRFFKKNKTEGVPPYKEIKVEIYRGKDLIYYFSTADDPERQIENYSYLFMVLQRYKTETTYILLSGKVVVEINEKKNDILIENDDNK